MALQIGKSYASVWEVQDKGNYTEVSMSTGRKDKRDDKYVNSNWGKFNRFVGNAHNDASKLADALKEKRPVRIVITSGIMTKEPYEKDGNKVFPQQPSLVVFGFDMADGGSEAGKTAKDADEIPF